MQWANSAGWAAAAGIAHLLLPVPPSANRWWRNLRGRTVTSKAARDYKSAVAAYALASRSPYFAAPTQVRVSVSWWRGRRAGDLDKRVGILLDALQGVVYDSDAQVVELHAYRHDVKARAPHVVITVSPVHVYPEARRRAYGVPNDPSSTG